MLLKKQNKYVSRRAIEKLSRIVDLMCVVVSKNYKYTDRSAVWSLDIQTMKITGYFILFCFLMRVIKIEVLTERDPSLSPNKLVVLLLPPTKNLPCIQQRFWITLVDVCIPGYIVLICKALLLLWWHHRATCPTNLKVLHRYIGS